MRGHKQTCGPLSQTLAQAPQISLLEYCQALTHVSILHTMVRMIFLRDWSDRINSVLKLLCGSHFSSPLSSLTSSTTLLPLFTPCQSQWLPCFRPGIHFTWIPHGSLPTFRSLFNYCLIKEALSNSLYFNKITSLLPGHSLSAFHCFISCIALIIICFAVYVCIVSFLPLEHEHHEDRGLVWSLLPPRTGPYELSPFVRWRKKVLYLVKIASFTDEKEKTLICRDSETTLPTRN